MNESLRTSLTNRSTYAPAEAAGADEAVADDADVLDLQSLVERVNAYGLHGQLVGQPGRENRVQLRGGLLVSAVSVALVVWLCYFVVVVAMRVNVWPF